VAVEGLLSGALAALWLTLLWCAAPILGSSPRDVVARLRDAIILGVAIPFGLGLIGLLYGPACYAAALVLWLARHASARAPADDANVVLPTNPWLALPLFAVALAAAPALMQPPLSGDTLIYHLPNAAAWARAGSIWQTSTTYWWWPGGSELFASGLLACGARWSVGASGAIACALLGIRITAWGIHLRAPAWAAATAGAAFVLTPVAALQAGNLGNDVWLAAFFMESLWCLQMRAQARNALGMTALVKPVGFVFAAVAALAGRARFRDAVAAAVPLTIWLARDAILWHGALIPPASTMYPHLWSTSIGMHGAEGAQTLAIALKNAGVTSMAWLALPLVGLFFRETRSVALAGALALVVFMFEPFGFASSLPQLATGASLRFGLPAMAVGAVGFCLLAARWPLIIGALAAASAAWGVVRMQALYWNDVATHSALPLIAVLAALIAFGRRRVGEAIWAIAGTGALMFLAWTASTRAADFYAASMRGYDGSPTGVFAWLAQHQPRRVLVEFARGGSVSMTSPRTAVFDRDVAADACDQARGLRALLIVGTDPAVAPKTHQLRLDEARACGRTLYEDSGAVVVDPGNEL
jgi:hypothetical protein